jgi:hypothetical protein
MGWQPSQKYMFGTIPVGAVTIRGGSLWLGADCITGFSMTVATLGTLTGAFRFYLSNDPRARQDASAAEQALARWDEFTTLVGTQIVNPAGAAVTFTVMVSDFRAGFMRMDYVGVSGIGAIESFYSGVGGG